MSWDLWLSNNRGVRIENLSKASKVTIVTSIDAIGAVQIIIPKSKLSTIPAIEMFIEARRDSRLISYGAVRKIITNKKSYSLIGYDSKEILARRIVAYKSGTAQAQKYAHSDNMMKNIVRENFGSLVTDAGRNMSGFLTVADNVSIGYIISKQFSFQNVFEILIEIGKVSAENGKPIYFTLTPQFSSVTGEVSFLFETYLNQPGTDRTAIGNSLVFGASFGNLTDSELTEDATAEYNYIYAGGQGDDITRKIFETSDSSRIGTGLWNRREQFKDARNEVADDALATVATTALNLGRPKFVATGKLINVEEQFGNFWNLGDRIFVEIEGRTFTALVRSLSITLEKGKEQIVGGLQIYA